MFRGWQFGSFLFAVAVSVLSLAPARAASTTVIVPGTADIWLAGQANGTTLQGVYASYDVAPANSPLVGSNGLNLTAGSYLTFSATGTTNYNGCTGASPDGGNCGNYNTGSYFGISTFAGPVNSLVGVFVGPGVPGGTAPAGLDFSTGNAQSQSTISPALNQVFFIGDGLTGTGTGASQHFVIPAGATRLFLGSADGAGANYDNPSNLAFNVTVTDAPPSSGSPIGTPAVSPFILLLTGLLLLGTGGYFLKARARVG